MCSTSQQDDVARGFQISVASSNQTIMSLCESIGPNNLDMVDDGFEARFWKSEALHPPHPQAYPELGRRRNLRTYASCLPLHANGCRPNPKTARPPTTGSHETMTS
jgi:hypothetical protein